MKPDSTLADTIREWRTEKWVDDYMAGEYFYLVFTPQRACADELTAHLTQLRELAEDWGRESKQLEYDRSREPTRARTEDSIRTFTMGQCAEALLAKLGSLEEE
jgi:hypothetical protein